MRALVFAFAIAATLPLSGCVSTLESAYDSEARQNCEQGPRRASAESCYERIDRERRERRRAAGD